MPSPEDCPLPLKYIDIFRHTQTDLSSSSEADIIDHYTDGPIELSDSWVGTTKFHLLRPQPEPGWEWVEGRQTKCQKSTRPGNIWPEVWQRMSPKAKKKAIDEWKIEEPKRNESRKLAGIDKHVKTEDLDDYLQFLATKRLELSPAACPAMPLKNDPKKARIAHAMSAISENLLQDDSEPRGSKAPDERDCSGHMSYLKHQENIAPKGFTSKEYFAMVHTPVPIQEAMKIPDARAAIDKEWDKLEQRQAWVLKGVREKSEVCFARLYRCMSTSQLNADSRRPALAVTMHSELVMRSWSHA